MLVALRCSARSPVNARSLSTCAKTLRAVLEVLCGTRKVKGLEVYAPAGYSIGLLQQNKCEMDVVERNVYTFDDRKIARNIVYKC